MIRAIPELEIGLSESAKEDLRRELEDAFERGDRVMVFWLRREPATDTTTVHALHYSSEACKVAWLSFLGALHDRLARWHAQGA